MFSCQRFGFRRRRRRLSQWLQLQLQLQRPRPTPILREMEREFLSRRRARNTNQLATTENIP